MNIIVLTSNEMIQAHLSEAYRSLNDDQRSLLKLSVMNLDGRQAFVLDSEKERSFEEADLLLFDAHGVRKEVVGRLSRFISSLTAHVVPVGSDSSDIRALTRLGSLRADDLHVPALRSRAHSIAEELRQDYLSFVSFNEYWRGGGAANMLGLLCMAGREYGHCDILPEPAEPNVLQELCIVDPATRIAYSSASAYWSSRTASSRPVVALFFLGNGNPGLVSDCIGPISSKIEEFADVLPIAFPSVMNISVTRLQELLQDAERRVNLLVNFLPFRLGSGPGGDANGEAKELLTVLGVPMLHPFFLSGMMHEEWEHSARGLNPSQLLVQVMLPELDGSIETYPVAALQRESTDRELGIERTRLALIPERTDKLIGRIRRWLNLQSTSNREKKLALIGYNYPPGEGNVFGGSFLDTFESLSRLLTLLKQNDYDVEEMTAEELHASFVEGGLVNSGVWSGEHAVSSMIRFHDSDFQRKLLSRVWGEGAVARWGEPPGDVMSEEGAFLLPGIINKNVFIGLQPSRGIHEHPEQAVHDRTLLPPHQYTAFYQWIREEWKADALVHIGTHGTLEFQQGKESGMSAHCIPDDFIGELPHLYFYYVGNPSEAMIAKRRSHALLIGYQAPPFMEAELYGEWSDLEALLHEYRAAEQLDPDRCTAILARMLDSAKQLHLNAGEPETIEEELYRMKRSLIPSGLHVLGEGYSSEEASAHMRFVLRHERGSIRSLRGLLADLQGRNTEAGAAGGETELWHELDQQAEAVVQAYIDTRELPESYRGAPAEWRAAMQESLEYGYTSYQASKSNNELQSLLRALEGRYIPAKLAGDALRSPEVLPSGYNLVQFDPRAVPSQTAAERGAATAENSIRRYYDEHGEYPNTTAVVLWGLETSRTQGETIGQILHYLGVRIAGGTMRTSYDIIPLEQLGRPRLNVVVQITGVFRDMFPNLLEDLNRLFQRISELDEPEEENYFKARTCETAASLSQNGYSAEEMADLASARIFGPAEGAYGTSVTRLIETKHWSGEDELGKAYEDSQHYVYSLTQRGRGEPELLRSHLKAVDIVSQIRSSHEHEVTDSDHYYEYFGGLSKAVEMAKGGKADIHITDTTGEHVITEEAERAIARGIQTRLTNPKWIDALLLHSYHGAQQIARRFENVMGLAATTGSVAPWVFEQLNDVYVKDESRSRQMEQNNKWAYHTMVETLLESHQRGYWKPDEETLDKLRRKYIELEGNLE
ncbi:cobaltochelatase subunit CobN [Paenibacillus sp. OAS669]|uniref:cobaltochelatase subunit CobN n=1 Tax=Paenibacillus sp. OAS669 TaxID=2663821 RepID=UPI00178BBE64|nr:cobaltochelatase subunit CobN [Paenibacillus sp. OAS669]MBE1442496.1 cobaltochelatase CobN [Paenibacillus sp. OAS669]